MSIYTNDDGGESTAEKLNNFFADKRSTTGSQPGDKPNVPNREHYLSRTFWYAKNNKYYYLSKHGDFKSVEKGDLFDHLKEDGLFNGYTGNAKEVAAVMQEDFKRFVVEVRNKHEIDWAGWLSGYQTGLHKLNGLRCLVTKGGELIEGVKGDCKETLDIIEQLLPDGQHHYVLSRHKLFIQALRKQRGFTFSHAIVIMGPVQCGKSLLLHRILTPLIGRYGNVKEFFFGGTKFNAELGYSESWVLDDSGENQGFDRRIVADSYKRAVAEPKVRIEAKRMDAINVEIPRLVTVLTNPETENVALIPELNTDNEDKITLLWASKVTLPVASGEEIEDLIKKQLPALMYYIEHEYEIPAEIATDDRFGIKAYHHPLVVAKVRSSSSAQHLVDHIKSYMRRNKQDYWRDSGVNMFEELLADPVSKTVILSISKGVNSFTQKLGQVAAQDKKAWQHDPNHHRTVIKDEDHHDRQWIIDITNVASGAKREHSAGWPEKIVQFSRQGKG